MDDRTLIELEGETNLTEAVEHRVEGDPYRTIPFLRSGRPCWIEQHEQDHESQLASEHRIGHGVYGNNTCIRNPVRYTGKRMRLILVSCLILVAVSTAPQGVAPTVPTPGMAVVHNGLELVDGACIGEIEITYGLRAIDYPFLLRTTPNATCALDIYFIDSSSTNSRSTYSGVSALFFTEWQHTLPVTYHGEWVGTRDWDGCSTWWAWHGHSDGASAAEPEDTPCFDRLHWYWGMENFMSWGASITTSASTMWASILTMGCWINPHSGGLVAGDCQLVGAEVEIPKVSTPPIQSGLLPGYTWSATLHS